MTWLPLALAYPALLTVVNFVDKYIIEREVQDARAMPIFAGLVGLLAAVVLALLGAATTLPIDAVALTIGAGVFVIIGAIFYFRAASIEQMSQIIILVQLAPLFVLVLSSSILNETITAQQFVGFWLILAAALGISVQRGTGGFRMSLAFWLMMAVNLTIALRILLIGLLPAMPSFGTLAVYQGIGQGLGALILYLASPAFRNAFHTSLATMRKPALGYIALNEALFLLAQGLISLAITLSPNTALVSVLSGTQVFYGLAIGWLLMAVAPGVFREAVSRQDLLRKLVFAALMFVGLWLVIML